MPARAQRDHRQSELLDVTSKLTTAPCVPKLRRLVQEWAAGPRRYKGATETTRELLLHWFHRDHRLPTGMRFRWFDAQREAMETLVYVWEVERVRSRAELIERFADDSMGATFPSTDAFPRYAVKMATGSGKTKVMALAIAWQFLNAQREKDEIAKQYARTFLVVAPNVIVLERLKTDFANGRIFQADPMLPRGWEIFWDFDCIVRGDGERPHADGALFLTNIQQLYEDRGPKSAEPDAMTAVLGPKPPANLVRERDFAERIVARKGERLLVLNDEAHHTWDDKNMWNAAIDRLASEVPLSSQLDFSATPRDAKGILFPWTISDYPLKQAILDRLVKRPMVGKANLRETPSQHASVRYRGFLVAGVERWKEYRDKLEPLGKKPVLFLMLTSTDEAEEVSDWLKTTYPEEFGSEKTLVIHTDKSGEISKKDLELARDEARRVDDDTSEVRAIVSVLMLREGWDVQNVTVIVGLRPYQASILPEQTVGRGLRLMFRGAPGAGYEERVDVIGTPRFLEFVQDLERLEGVQLGTFQLGKDQVELVTIEPEAKRAEFDLGIPVLSPMLVRKKSIAAEIEALDVSKLPIAQVKLEAKETDIETFIYEGYDAVTLRKELEREYRLEPPATAQEVIGYYARRIAEKLKLPAQFAVLVPKVREFIRTRTAGGPYDLDDPMVVRGIANPLMHFVVVETFRRALAAIVNEPRVPELLAPPRLLSTCPGFPWSRVAEPARKTVFNLIPCDNEFERAFARFLDGAKDCAAFAKLPMRFGFAIEYVDPDQSLRLYTPDFVVRRDDGVHLLIETKGYEGAEVAHKDHAARSWCDNATSLTGVPWRYLKVKQERFEQLALERVSDLDVLAPPDLPLGG